ncbi:MAG: peptidylprolyl isomerase [Myxococcota bacterium]
MLKILRKGQRWVTGLFVAAIGGVFVFFIGLGAPLQRSATAVVQVGADEFGYREFSRVRAQRENAFQQQLGSDFDARKMRDTLDQVAISALVEQAILAQEAADLGLTVAKAEIERFILSASYFRNEDGNFDPQQFDDWAQYEYGNQQNFIKEQRSYMLSSKLIQLLNRLARVSEGEARQAVIARRQEVSIAFVQFDAAAPLEGFEPDPAELQAFLTTHGEELRALYESRSSTYDVPEQVRARHILFQVPVDADDANTEEIRAVAQGVIDRIEAGEDMAKLAEELSDDPGSKSEGGDLGFIGRGQMVPEFEKAAFSQEIGKLGLTQSSYGFHAIRVEARREAESRSFEQVQNELATERLAIEAAQAINLSAAESLSEAVRGGQSLEDAARAADRSLERSGRLRRRPDGFVPGLGAAQELMAVAFSLESGQSSSRVFEVDGKLALVQVIERFEPDEADIDSAVDPERQRLVASKRQNYLSTWINQRRGELAEKGELIVNLDLIGGT